jgi:hypothetical protein
LNRSAKTGLSFSYNLNYLNEKMIILTQRFNL